MLRVRAGNRIYKPMNMRDTAHSCQLNTEIVLWDFNGRNRAFIQATYDIPPKSWLSFDYNSQYHRESASMPKVHCKCTVNCLNFI